LGFPWLSRAFSVYGGCVVAYKRGVDTSLSSSVQAAGSLWASWKDKYGPTSLQLWILNH
jgi:hypothetical protein